MNTSLSQLEKLVTEHACCLRCLGRMEPAVGSIELDSSIIQTQSFPEDIRSQTVDETDCDICQGSVVQAIELADRLIPNLAKYEFSTFLVGCSMTKELELLDQILGQYTDEYQDLKFEIRKEIGLRIVKELEKEVDFQLPQIAIVVDTKKFRYNIDIRSLYILGRYKKLTRGLPQTKWPCSDCRGRGCESCDQTGQQYPKTVETTISPYFLEKTGGIDASFHGAGREDIDALMLGTGRPFVLEIKDPRVRSIDLDAAMDVVNNDPDVEITDLRFCDKDTVAYIKESSPDSKKSYRATTKLSRTVTEQDLSIIEEFGKEEHVLQQRTPSRVNHRRADKVREKSIYGVSVRQIDDITIQLDIRAEGGAYIKEFISGDDDRTTPSIAELLDISAVCTALDVIAVDDKGLFS